MRLCPESFVSLRKNPGRLQDAVLEHEHVEVRRMARGAHLHASDPPLDVRVVDAFHLQVDDPVAEELLAVLPKFLASGPELRDEDRRRLQFPKPLEQLEQLLPRILEPGHDLEPVSAVRQSFPGILLQVDANGGYAPDQFEQLLPLDEFDLLLIEQPFAGEQLLAHARLQERLATPICLDESIGSEVEARQALDLGACRIVNIKPGRVGGLSEAVAIHDVCRKADIPVWCGGMLETGVGRAANLALATLPGFSLPGDISATDRYYEEDIASPKFVLNSDGTIDVPTSAGLGITIDSGALERVTLRRERFTAGQPSSRSTQSTENAPA